MKHWEVWIEGYACNGDRGLASFEGVADAETFVEACKIVLKKKKWDLKLYNEENNSYWGCRFFPTEQEARAIFG